MEMKITVEALVKAPLETVWSAWTTPADIMAWNAALDYWHTTASTVDLRPGGIFSSRMEAKVGSFAFDFAGRYTRIEPLSLIEAQFSDRMMSVAFSETADGVKVVEIFDAEETNPAKMQRMGWQDILDRFKAHVESKAR
jgi:uncharacterized protein YndB with AHSA1/START domain